MSIQTIQSLSYASTNVTTGAYVTLAASIPVGSSKIIILDTSGQVIKLAVGAAGSEQDLCVMPVSGQLVIDLSLNVLPAGSRLSLKAISASATTGYAVVSLFQ